MELCTHHKFIKADGHDRSLQRNMGPFLFNSQYCGSFHLKIAFIFFYDLIIPAVHCIKRIFQPMKYTVFFTFGFHMYWENTERCRFSLCYFSGFKKAARELEGMAYKEYIFFVVLACYFIFINHIIF